MNKGTKFELQRATEEDISLIGDMAADIWKVHYTPIIGEKQVNYMLGKGYSPEGLLLSMQKGEEFYLCRMDGNIIGYVSVSKKAEGEYFMNKFYLEISEQGKGAGRNFFTLLLAMIGDPVVMRLQVNRLNYKTINFYFRMGFVIEYAKDFDIGDGYSMDDYVMIRKKK